MVKKIIISLLTMGLVITLIYGAIKIKRFLQIDSCLDKGGSWNYELNICEEFSQINNEDLSDYYWKTIYDTIYQREYLVKGKSIVSIDKYPHEQIEVLNKRNEQPKIEYINIQSDTIIIHIVNDEYLTEQMGTTGAFCYLGETVFTLTENKLINYVKIEMDAGSHASPGTYTRDNFKNLIK